jgi:antitoxin (DNA-binding transcriptional repressor) of toxin-antitoxin stability system
MEITSLKDAESKLAILIERALAGEEIILSLDGKPLVKLIPLEQKAFKKRVPGGSWKGKIKIAENFDEEDKEIVKMFEGEPL